MEKSTQNFTTKKMQKEGSQCICSSVILMSIVVKERTIAKYITDIIQVPFDE